jgi:hypothetical protein
MANALNLYVDCTDGSLLLNTVNQSNVDPRTLPIYFGDTLTINIYLYARDPSAGQSGFPFLTINNAGLLVTLIIFDGTASGPNGALTPYAACVNFVPDPTNSYVQGTLNLNTAKLQTLIGANATANAYIGIGYIQAGGTATCFTGPIIVGAGVQSGPLVPVPGLMPLSQQAAALEFFPIAPVAGQVLYLATATGKVIMVYAVDDANGGHLDSQPTGQTVPV